jgi:hypothetical protein
MVPGHRGDNGRGGGSVVPMTEEVCDGMVPRCGGEHRPDGMVPRHSDDVDVVREAVTWTRQH